MRTHFRNSTWAILEYAAYPALVFIATPWFLKQLGTEHFGHWMLLTAAAGFGNVLTAGTGAATIKAISASIGRNEKTSAKKALDASYAIALIAGGCLGFIVLLVFWLAGNSLLSRMGDPGLVRLTGATAAVLICLEQIGNVFSSAMKGAEEFAYAAQIEILCRTIQVIAVAGVIWPLPSLWTVYAVLVAIAVARVLIKKYAALRLLGIVTLRPSLSEAREILHFAKWGWLQGVGGTLFSVADRILIGSLLGPTSLAHYSIASQLAMQVHAVAAAGLSIVFPRVSRRLEASKNYSLRSVTLVTFLANLIFSSALAFLLFAFGPTILHYWVGPENAAPSADVLPWLVTAYWLLALNVVPYYILLGMGRMRFIGLTVLASGSVAAVATYFAINAMGLVGAPVGRGLYAMLSLALAFPLAKQIFQEQKKRRLKPSGLVRSGDTHE